MSYKSNSRGRNSRNNASGLSKGHDKDSKEYILEKTTKGRHRSSDRRDGEGYRSSNSGTDRHGSGRRHSRERRSRSRNRDNQKHRTGRGRDSQDDRENQHRSREHTDDFRTDIPNKYAEQKSIEYMQNVISNVLENASTADDFDKLLNSYNPQQQIKTQLHENSSIGSKGNNATGAQMLCNGSSSSSSGGESSRRRKKKSRWADSDHEKTIIPGMPTVLPSTLTPDQQEAYLVQLQIEEISRMLRTGDIKISPNREERSPSPEPVYGSDGKRLNTREFRTRKKLEEQRHQLIQRMQSLNPDFKPPSDYKPPVMRASDKVLIPQEEYPDFNFVGLLLGPRGNTLKALEQDTGAKIIIRGKGSVKEGKVGRWDGQSLPGEVEPLHAFITASKPEAVRLAVDRIKDVIRQGIELPEGSNDLRRMQLRELAQLNGTLRETDGFRCSNCGSNQHKSWFCPDKANNTNHIVCVACGGSGHIARDCRSKRPGHGGPPVVTNFDEEYMSLMAELSGAPPVQESYHRNLGGGGGARGSYNMSRSAPRPHMARQHHPSTMPALSSGGDGSRCPERRIGVGNNHRPWRPMLTMPSAPFHAPPPTEPSLMQRTPPQTACGGDYQHSYGDGVAPFAMVDDCGMMAGSLLPTGWAPATNIFVPPPPPLSDILAKPPPPPPPPQPPAPHS